MLEWNLLSCLMFPSIVARAFLSVILVLFWSSERTYRSSGVQSIHCHVGDFSFTGAESLTTTSFFCSSFCHSFCSLLCPDLEEQYALESNVNKKARVSNRALRQFSSTLKRGVTPPNYRLFSFSCQADGGMNAGCIRPPSGPLSSSSTSSLNRAANTNPPNIDAAMSNMSFTTNLGWLDLLRDKIQLRQRIQPLLHDHSVFLLFR